MSNSQVNINEKALSRAMGRAYADSDFREALDVDPTEALTSTGVLEEGQIDKVTLSPEIDEWGYRLEHGGDGTHLILGVPDISEELGDNAPEDNVYLICCCCCPC
ncbi:hypothetical protein PT279_00620 [Bifidobacterium sp. ESL0784]|uniref:hypothetical protein n=1 Tax=Bifidobacterium sp. ESL0784 TaxID=2983231 RepID=UPI0023F72155|nr:hypothetical protein [Bifidobacterium sp. ESL0784]MDF7640108.1 hypothetical protein [Bifidobacterium sp. ESL0784]